MPLGIARTSRLGFEVLKTTFFAISFTFMFMAAFKYVPPAGLLINITPTVGRTLFMFNIPIFLDTLVDLDAGLTYLQSSHIIVFKTVCGMCITAVSFVCMSLTDETQASVVVAWLVLAALILGLAYVGLSVLRLFRMITKHFSTLRAIRNAGTPSEGKRQLADKKGRK